MRQQRKNRIKELREKRDLTLQQIADAAGTSLQQIHKLENGDRRLTDEWMRRIAPILGVHPAALLLEFAEDQHSVHESVEEVLLLETFRLFDDTERRELLDKLVAIRRRITATKLKQKA